MQQLSENHKLRFVFRVRLMSSIQKERHHGQICSNFSLDRLQGRKNNITSGSNYCSLLQFTTLTPNQVISSISGFNWYNWLLIFSFTFSRFRVLPFCLLIWKMKKQRLYITLNLSKKMEHLKITCLTLTLTSKIPLRKSI